MAASLQPSSSKTTILDLNDDCLMEVFAHMNRKTLTTAADVCTRFEQNTMHAALLKIKGIRLNGNKKLSVHEYSMLRNFGKFIENVEVVAWDCLYEKRIFEYLSTHFVGKSIELNWFFERITDEIAIILRPQLGRAEKLQFYHCHLDEVLRRNLPLWSAGLQESEYGASEPVNDREKQIDHLRLKNLKTISFVDVSGFKNAHIEELLQQNPQIKEIRLIWCVGVDSCVLESIARNVPAIEKIGFVMENGTSHRDHIKFFLRLRKLKSLTLRISEDDSFVQSAVHEIASVNTGLEHLDLCGFDLLYNADQFIEGISKLQQLKTLRLRYVRNLTVAHIVEICKQAKELSDIYEYLRLKTRE